MRLRIASYYVRFTGIVCTSERNTTRAELLSRQAAKQKNAQNNEENIREPDQQFRMRMRISSQRIANDYKQEIGGGNDQAHRESD